MRTRTEFQKSCASTTRRGFLASAALAGLGVALRGSPALLGQDSRRIPARFVGEGFERGHHWTASDPEKFHVDRTEKKAVVIVGGGLAGMTAAWRLLEAGVDDFVVLELEDKPGGLARNGLMGKTVVPFGGVTMQAPHEGTSRAVLRLLEIAGVDRTTIPFRPDVLERGHWVETEGPTSRIVGEITKPADLDAITVAELGRADGAVEIGRTEWCLRRFGARTTEVSVDAFRTDASHRLGGVLVLPEGLGSLLAPIIPKVGPRLLSARVAILVKPDGKGARVRAVNANDAFVTDYEAGAAILALPPFISRKICPTFQQRDEGIGLPETSPWLVTAIMVSRWPKGFDPKVRFHRTLDERASLIVHAGEPPEAVIVCQRPFPGPATTPSRMFLRDLDRNDARDWAFRELAPVFPDLQEIAIRVELWRVGHGSIRPAPGWITKMAPRLRQPLAPIYPCGADLAGIPSAESAIDDGVRGAEAVLASLGKLDKSWR